MPKRIILSPRNKIIRSRRKRKPVGIDPRSSYTLYHPKRAFRLALLGKTNVEMSEVFGISVVTFNVWMHKYPKFANAVSLGRTEADAKVAHSMFKRATGFSKRQVKIFNHMGEPLIVPYDEYYPPDTGAARNWLSNRQRGLWAATPEPDDPKPTNPLISLNFNVNPVEAAAVYQKLIQGG